MISNKKQIAYVIELAQNEINNTTGPTTSLLAVIIGILIGAIVGIGGAGVTGNNSSISITAAVVILLLFLCLILVNKYFNQTTKNHDELSEVIQTGTKLKYQKKITPEEGCNFYQQVKDSFNQKPSLAEKLVIISEIK